MKLKWMIISVSSGILAVLLVCLLSAQSNNAAASTPFIALSHVSVPEIPAKAADLVQAATILQREATASAVLRAISTMTRPGVMPYVVSAICRRNPEVTGAVVSTAISLQPDDELPFCRAAVCAAPDQVEQVVTSACQAVPGSFANVALVAFERLPAANHLILDGLTNTLPELKPYLDQASLQNGTNDFESLINQAVQLLNDAAKPQLK